jgi:hypothetical protein
MNMKRVFGNHVLDVSNQSGFARFQLCVDVSSKIINRS